MIDKLFAETFARNWIEAWNSHDLNRILAYYSEDLEFSSPNISRIANELSGTLKDKAAVADYWAKGLALFPGLKFDLLGIFVGINSIVLQYRDDRGKINAETFDFGPDLLIHKSAANHAL